VGESGSGKSVHVLAMLGLVPRPPARIAGGQVLFGGRDLLALSEPELRDIRGRDIAFIFQDPMTALNPVLTVGRQIMEPLRRHFGLSPAGARARAAELLELVGIPDPARRARDYPHQMSGGMRQRVMIAIALAAGPKLLLADEPTTALDVTIQDQILRLLLRLKDELGMALVLVTHDLGVVAGTCDRVAVLYAGQVMESGPTAPLFTHPAHAYTLGLLGSLPDAARARQRLEGIPGLPPDPLALPPGCRFSPRCAFVQPACRVAPPPLLAVGAGHASACLRAEVVRQQTLEHAA